MRTGPLDRRAGSPVAEPWSSFFGGSLDSRRSNHNRAGASKAPARILKCWVAQEKRLPQFQTGGLYRRKCSHREAHQQ